MQEPSHFPFTSLLAIPTQAITATPEGSRGAGYNPIAPSSLPVVSETPTERYSVNAKHNRPNGYRFITNELDLRAFLILHPSKIATTPTSPFSWVSLAPSSLFTSALIHEKADERADNHVIEFEYTLALSNRPTLHLRIPGHALVNHIA
ncbi:hypothetical protein EV361DRAFT_948680 [Lentinula raphanica]|nr:hypothetical protein F5880DRAFT_1616949 [Lentinula raphanica]KAJ3972595.1 hypothetical protein EV361DRAFT_948680 [Lentinula raphanica]